jgi:Pycsar effector protein
VTSTHESLLGAELAAVRGEQVRIDSKCSTLAGLAGASLLFLVAQVGDHHTSLITRVLLGVAAVALTAAAVILLLVIRPKLGSTGFNKYAQMSGEEIRRELIVDGTVGHRRLLANELVILSRITLHKQIRLRLAVALLVTGVLGIAAAMLAGVIA